MTKAIVGRTALTCFAGWSEPKSSLHLKLVPILHPRLLLASSPSIIKVIDKDIDIFGYKKVS